MKNKKIKNRGFLFTDNSPQEWGVNLYLILGKRNNYIIDTGLGSSSIKPVREYIENTHKPIIVINTHYHWDHIWGNRSMQECTIISHKLCKDMIETHWQDMLQKHQQFCTGNVEMSLPNLIFEKELYFPEDQIKLIYTPGHTPDSISVIDEKEKVIHIGDNIGDTMDDLIPNLNCDKNSYIHTLLQYRDMDFDTCISGHNVVLGKAIIDKMLNIL